MIEIIKTVNLTPPQYGIIIEGMRNPMNSWDDIDSDWDDKITPPGVREFSIGPNDYKLMEKLAVLPPENPKYRRMMSVWFTANAPLYWWKEFDTYQVGRVTNSCSTMHRIAHKPFVMSDFSCEHLIDDNPYRDTKSHCSFTAKKVLETVIIPTLNHYREVYLETKSKEAWWQLIQLLPSSYNQRRTIWCNYETLHNIYRQRHEHKLDEWVDFCKWIEALPYSELITIGVKK